MSADALFQAILANPDDDLPRLVYADWLEEHGKPDTAAFIRTQIALARTPRWDPLWVRCSLVDNSWIYGRGHNPPESKLTPGVKWKPARYRRGFPCRVEVEVTDLTKMVKHATRLFCTTLTDAIELKLKMNGQPWNYELFAQPRLSHVRTLEFHLGNMTARQLRPVLDSPHLTNLTSLRFEYGALQADGLAAVMASPLVTPLRELLLTYGFSHVNGAPLGDAFETLKLPELERLDVEEKWLDAGTLTRLLKGNLPKLTRLSLARNNVGEQGTEVLATWAGRTRIQWLDLTANRLTVKALQTLCASDWPELRILKLASNKLDPRVGDVLAGAKWLPGLRILDLTGANLSDAGAKALADSPAVAGLLALKLRDNGITDAAARALLESRHLGNLMYLDVANNDISVDLQTALRARFNAKSP